MMIFNLKQHYRKYLLKQDERIYKKEKGEKAIVSYPPRWITIGITSTCNNRCVFCSYHCEDARDFSNVYGINYNLDLTDFKRIVDMAYRGRVPNIHICGTGEPFMNRQVLSMMDYAIEVYGHTSIQTNFHKPLFEKYGYLDELINRKNYISYITTDVMSGRPEQHNELKRGSDYEDVIASLKYLSDKSNIPIKAHMLLTKLNFDSINLLIDDLHYRDIKNCSLNIVNLYSYDFNKYSGSDVVYTSEEKKITDALEHAILYGKEKNVQVTIPEPADMNSSGCDVFWTKIQIWPVKGNDPKRYHENLIPHACRAVVRGDLNSLGYIFDYQNVMDFWNNETIVSIRDGIIKGSYPSPECKYCYCYPKKDNLFKLKAKWKKSADKNLQKFISSIEVQSLNENSICIDCGANVGIITAIMAERGAKVIAFEPHPFAFQKLSEKFKDNPNVTCIQKAVLNKYGRMRLYMYQHSQEDPLFWSQGSSTYNEKDDINIADYVEVDAINLIDYIKHLDTEIDILKIDVEGGEYDILYELIAENMHKNIKYILVETHEKRIPSIKEKGKLVRQMIAEKHITNISLDWV